MCCLQVKSATTIAELPWDILVIIMQHVSLQHRFSTCCLVSANWNALARLATTAVNTQPTAAVWRKLEPWPKKCKASSNVTTLTLNKTPIQCSSPADAQQSGGGLQLPAWPGPDDDAFDPISMKELPQRLRRLEVTYCNLVADHMKAGGIGWSIRPGPLLGLKQLTHLSIDVCYTDAIKLRCLGALTSLQHLSLTRMHVFNNNLAHVYNSLLALSAPSSVQQHLTHLTLGNKVSTDSQPTMFAGLSDGLQGPQATTGNITLGDKMVPFSRLGALRELKLAGFPVTAAALQGLSALPHLTWLMLDETADNSPNISTAGDSSSSSLTGLASLTALQRLQLRSAGTLHPDVLGALHRLCYLEITDTPVSGGPQGMSDFLDALHNLQHLSYLFWAQSEGHEWAESPQAYAALTASGMQELHINLMGDSGTSPRLLKHMFSGL
jgi:hypothetical protein